MRSENCKDFCRYRDTDNRWGHRVDTISEKKYVNPEASVCFSSNIKKILLTSTLQTTF